MAADSRTYGRSRTFAVCQVERALPGRASGLRPGPSSARRRRSAGLRVYAHHRMLGLEHLGDEFAAIGLELDVDAAYPGFVDVRGIVVGIGVHRPQFFGERL